jgi:hypothetical protein
MTEDNEFNETEKEFYENIAKVASTVNRRLHGSIAPEGTNDTVDPDDGITATDQMDLDQDDNHFPL